MSKQAQEALKEVAQNIRASADAYQKARYLYRNNKQKEADVEIAIARSREVDASNDEKRSELAKERVAAKDAEVSRLWAEAEYISKESEFLRWLFGGGAAFGAFIFAIGISQWARGASKEASK